MLSMMRKAGISSQILFTAGFGSIALTIASWVVSKRTEGSTNRADHWGLFIGEWAPTFFALGTAMRLEEHWSGQDVQREYEQEARRTGAPMPVG